MGLPLPPNLSAQLDAPDLASRSLLFDRGFGDYEADWRIEAGAKQGFLEKFRQAFSSEPSDFRPFIARRRGAMEELKAHRLSLITQSRLVTGLGLPHPTGIGFLLDRTTGCPYLPGSSVKGLLRAAARLVAEGELETADPGDGEVWREQSAAVFGPDRSDATPARGTVVFFDAFPTAWPALELDVLTPHYQAYYGGENGESPPADWYDPVPVAFLTVKAGTEFEFHFLHVPLEATTEDPAPNPLEALDRLLRTALDWLAIGGKKSSGLGVFGDSRPAEPQTLQPQGPSRFEPGGQKQRFERQAPPPPAPPPRKPPGEAAWTNVELELTQGRPTIFRGSQTATCAKEDLSGPLLRKLQKLRKGKTLRVNARVVKKGGGEWRIASVEEAEE